MVIDTKNSHYSYYVFRVKYLPRTNDQTIYQAYIMRYKWTFLKKSEAVIHSNHVFYIFQLSDYLEGVNVETSSSLSVTVTTKKSAHSWTFSFLCRVGWNVYYQPCTNLLFFLTRTVIGCKVNLLQGTPAGVGPNPPVWVFWPKHSLSLSLSLTSRLESCSASPCSMMRTDPTSSSQVCHPGSGCKLSPTGAKSGLPERRSQVRPF